MYISDRDGILVRIKCGCCYFFCVHLENYGSRWHGIIDMQFTNSTRKIRYQAIADFALFTAFLPVREGYEISPLSLALYVFLLSGIE